MDTWSQEFRHQCLVRYVITMRIKSRKDAIVFLNKWKDTHKTETLEEDVRVQWFRGNRGKPNDWRYI